MGKKDKSGDSSKICEKSMFLFITSHPVFPNPRTTPGSISVILILILLTCLLLPCLCLYIQFTFFVYLYLPRQQQIQTRLLQRYCESHSFFFPHLKWDLVCVMLISLSSVYGQSPCSFLLFRCFPGVHTPPCVCFGQ